MALSIKRLSPDQSAYVDYVSPAFRQVIEDHLSLLIAGTNYKPRTVMPDGDVINRNQGDFYGILRELDVPAKYWWVILRANGYVNTDLFEPVHKPILLPDFKQIDDLMSRYRRVQR